MEIKVADVAELVDARDLKSPGATEITHLSDLTRAGTPNEAGGDPAVLSNTPPPLPLAGRPSKTWADVFLPTSINRRKDRCRLLQSAIASWSLCAAVSTKGGRISSSCGRVVLLGSIAQNSFESGVEIPPNLRHALIAILAKERRWPVIFKDSPALLVLEQKHPERRV